tara:strand:- start:344 stop:1429 length:1086 start_codon:yes stop_codon:yes gene_type:complete
MISLFKVHKPDGVSKVLEEVFDSGFLTEGNYSDKFEKDFSEFIGNPNTCLTNSCTSALDLARHMCDIQNEDEVITTAMTCLATNLPFYQRGAKLVFADVKKETGNIDPEDIERKITPKTKAIVVVHWAGQPVDIEAISSISSRHNIPVIEDAAHALDSKYKGLPIGQHSDFVCFSFQAIKHLTCADGGAIACKRQEDAERIRRLRWFGLDRSVKGIQRWSQDISEGGYKYHMNNLNAAIGIEQLKNIRYLISQHKLNSAYYDENINNPRIKKLQRDENSDSASWIYSLLTEDREDFQSYLSKNDIASDWVHVRNDQYTIFKNFKIDLPNLDYFESRLINIPVGWWLSKSDIKHIVDTVNKY